MRGNFRKLLRKFCLESSIGGLKYFYLYPNLFSRCFWAINLLCITIICGCTTWLLYCRFAEMPTRITIENQFESVADLPYPAISLCTPNQITISSMRHLNRTLVDGNRTQDLGYLLKQMLGFYKQGKLDLDALAQLQSLIELNRYNIPEVMMTLPQSCDRFLKLCFFRRKRYPNCKGLFKPILTYNGLCCIFNGLYSFQRTRNEPDPNFKYRKVLRAGLTEGLTVVTDSEPWDALDGSMLASGSTLVMVNSWDEFPANDELSLVTTNSESMHPISATYTYCSPDVINLRTESRKCYFKDEHPLDFFRQYHNSDCDLMCFVHAVEHACDCLLFFLPRLKVMRACNATSLACIYRVKMEMHLWTRTQLCDCPRDCDSHVYKLEMTVGNLDALPYLISNIYSDILFNKSTSIMHFFFPTSVYVKQKQETVMSIITLESNLGGMIGLYLGCSILSFIEILFYIYAAIRNYIKNWLLKKVAKHRIGYFN